MQPCSSADVRGGRRGFSPRVDGEKPLAPLSQAVGREGWIFYTVTTVLPFPGEIRDKHEGDEGRWGGQENRPWEEGEGGKSKVLATQHERESVAFRTT